MIRRHLIGCLKVIFQDPTLNTMCLPPPPHSVVFLPVAPMVSRAWETINKKHIMYIYWKHHWLFNLQAEVEVVPFRDHSVSSLSVGQTNFMQSVLRITILNFRVPPATDMSKCLINPPHRVQNKANNCSSAVYTPNWGHN